MEETHVTRELLRAVTDGDLPACTLTQIGLQHMRSSCPLCRREIDAFLGISGQTAPYYLSALETVLEQQEPYLLREERDARRDFKRILALPQEKRAGAIFRAQTHYRSATFIQLLIQASEETVHRSPSEAFLLAELARTATQHSPRLREPFELLALASAAMGNAKRARGSLREAEKIFGHVRAMIRDGNVTEPSVLARIDDLEGSLRRDQRLLAQAQELFTRAATLYRLSGASIAQNRTLLKLASVQFNGGSLAAAIGTLRVALRRIPREPHSRLHLCARYNLALYLVEAGRFADADCLLAEDVPLYENFPEPWTQLRRTWLQGKIAAGLGQLGQAEMLLLETRDGFIAQGIGYDAAMVAVEDLALLYLSQGRNDAVKRLAEETSVVFTAQDVHREAMAALLLFQEAARRESLTQRWVGELARYLKEAQRDPSCRFEGEPNPLEPRL